MLPSDAQHRRIWPSSWSAALRDRLRFVRLLPFVCAGVLIGGHIVLPDGLRGLSPAIIAVELAVGGFAAYLMHTLAEVLQRDQSRKRALRDSEQRFRSVIENLRDALLITDLDDRITLANRRVRDVRGYTARERVGH